MPWLSGGSRFNEPEKGEPQMDDIILKAARAIGLASHVSVAPFDGGNPLVTVSFPPKAVRSRIPVRYLLDEDLGQLKIILADMGRMAKLR